ncbi:MAG: AAA family ATPase [Gammaproteobacteria bacterium]
MTPPVFHTAEPPSPASDDETAAAHQEILDGIIAAAGEVILGKAHELKLALACLIARGHLLIEDLPGVGKTTLAHVLAKALGLQFRRIQFTSDLLPADILGTTVYDRQEGGFSFHRGPIFAQLVLADEVNRATPKTQSALLEAMEENQVTVEGHTYPLPEPFFVVATQNPNDQIGTFPLPESQLDRFLMRLQLGYPDAAAERILLKGEERRVLLKDMAPATDSAALAGMQSAAARVNVSDALVDYVQALLRFSREAPYYRNGLSPRAGVAIVRAAQAWALMAGRRFVVPEDVQAVLPAVATHRLQAAAETGEQTAAELFRHLATVAVP